MMTDGLKMEKRRCKRGRTAAGKCRKKWRK